MFNLFFIRMMYVFLLLLIIFFILVKVPSLKDFKDVSYLYEELNVEEDIIVTSNHSGNVQVLEFMVDLEGYSFFEDSSLSLQLYRNENTQILFTKIVLDSTMQYEENSILYANGITNFYELMYQYPIYQSKNYNIFTKYDDIVIATDIAKTISSGQHYHHLKGSFCGYVIINEGDEITYNINIMVDSILYSILIRTDQSYFDLYSFLNSIHFID